MASEYTGATFWKCALQVNPWSYAEEYRRTPHGLTEEQYNQRLGEICREQNIKILAVTDHGSVSDIESIKDVMAPLGVVVFPGFEINSSEQAHFVCLFPEDMDINRLYSEMTVGLEIDPANPEDPVNKTAADIIAHIDGLGGLVYAAHVTNDSGILKKRLSHLWRLRGLVAAQIPGSVEDLKAAESGFYYQVARNRDPNYRREVPLAIINACDVEIPDRLAEPGASCLVKMTKPCFASFKQAFLDPESRIRLNSDISSTHASAIENVTVIGGYLDGLDITIADHLNAIIGGRGTGKSTLIECIRFALDIRPPGKNAQRQHDEMIKENLGKEKAQVLLRVRSATMRGQTFWVSRRYGDNPIVKDDNGTLAPFSPKELLPQIEIFGQNEIYEITQDPSGQRQLLSRFLSSQQNEAEERISQIRRRLSENREAIIKAREQRAEVETDVAQLPKLEAEAATYKALGLEEKLKIIPLLETEKQLATRVRGDTDKIAQAIHNAFDVLPDTAFLSEQALAPLPHANTLREQRKLLEQLACDVKGLLTQAGEAVERAQSGSQPLAQSLTQQISQEEEELKKQFKSIPNSQGKSGAEIGADYQRILRALERIKPSRTKLAQRKQQLDELARKRQAILAELADGLSEHSAKVQRALRKLQKKLEGKLRLTVEPEGNRQPLMDFLTACQLEGVGPQRLAWIKNTDCSPASLAATIRQGSEDLLSQGWSITPSTASALAKLPPSKILELEEVCLPDHVKIELNIAHEDAPVNYRELHRLSTGQQCTAVLHLLLLDNPDPLILDQPEDNLDNAFIAERIVAELRKAKLDRQFLFATHNANIPVFGDAEWIGVFQAKDDRAGIPAEHQGAIDLPEIQRLSANILEGGRKAFDQRRLKYGF